MLLCKPMGASVIDGLLNDSSLRPSDIPDGKVSDILVFLFLIVRSITFIGIKQY